MIWFDWVLWHINQCRLFNAKSILYIYIKCIWFGWFGFMAYQPLLVIWCQILFIHIYWIYMIWFGLVLWHINHWRLFDAKSSLHIYIKYIWFGLVGFYGISIIVGYLMPNPIYTYILDISDLVWFGFMAYQPLLGIWCQILFIHIYWIYMIWFGRISWHVKYCRLFIEIKQKWFSLVWLYGISPL